MPLARLDKARETLPEGYKFGDAATHTLIAGVFVPDKFIAETFIEAHPECFTLYKRDDDGAVTTFRLGVDTCATCGTNGKYDCPECGIWNVIEGDTE